MSDDRYSLAEARAIIDAEKCERSGAFGDWCIQHDSYLPSDWATCAHHPGEVADVAEQLLATVERVLGLEQRMGPDHPLYPYLRDAINGEEVAK